MSNPMKYIRDLEAVGFQRTQAEAQVQVVLDAIEGDLVTKSDFAVFQERSDNRAQQFDVRMDNRLQVFESRMEQFEARIEARMDQFEDRMENRFHQFNQQIAVQIRELEYRMTIRLGIMMVSSLSIAVAMLAWLIKV